MFLGLCLRYNRSLLELEQFKTLFFLYYQIIAVGQHSSAAKDHTIRTVNQHLRLRLSDCCEIAGILMLLRHMQSREHTFAAACAMAAIFISLQTNAQLKSTKASRR